MNYLRSVWCCVEFLRSRMIQVFKELTPSKEKESILSSPPQEDEALVDTKEVSPLPKWLVSLSNRFRYVNTLSESRDKVYLAKDMEHNGRLVALKLHDEEAKMLKYLRGHENILTLYDTITISSDGDQVTPDGIVNPEDINSQSTNSQSTSTNLCVMEYASRGDLFYMVERYGGLSRSRAHTYFRQLVQGLQFMHERKVAHLDLTCENIFLFRDKKLKIGDFGESFFVTSRRIKYPPNHLPGKIRYRCPEMYMENGFFDPYAADVFALGVVLFHMLTGCSPFHEANPIKDRLYLYISKGWLHKNVRHFQLEHLINDDACDLIQRMLNFEPTRITLAEIQQHKWYVTDPLKEKMMQNMTKNMPK